MSEQKTSERPKLTKEEVEARKAEMTAWHKEQIPFLETQLKYESLLTKVQQAITDRTEAEYKWIQLKSAMMGKDMLGGEPDPEEQPAKSNEKPTMTATRTLKKDQSNADQ